jgi:hypothetical protein
LEKRRLSRSACEAKRVLVVLQACQTITDAALAHLRLDDVLHRLLAQVQAALAVDTVVVLLPADDQGTLVVRASLGRDAETPVPQRKRRNDSMHKRAG